MFISDAHKYARVLDAQKDSHGFGCAHVYYRCTKYARVFVDAHDYIRVIMGAHK